MSADLTVILYTCNEISPYFAKNTQEQLLRSIEDLPLISVSHKPMSLGHDTKNMVVKMPRHHLSIYKQALIGADAARTKYIALVEDDVLYSPQHFHYRPSPGKFAYNMGVWGVYSWNPLYSWKGRRNLGQMICERELFIEAMHERLTAWPDDSKIDLSIWSEPGKYERQLGVSVRETEEFWTNPPNIMFFHETALSYQGLGTRKRLGELRAESIPFWGPISDIMRLYEEK